MKIVSVDKKHLWCKVRWFIPIISFTLALLAVYLVTHSPK